MFLRNLKNKICSNFSFLLFSLQRFTEAEESFSRVLQLDPECEEARSEIALVQKQRLTEMGFTISQAEKAIAKYQQVQVRTKEVPA